ncbi:MAG TPA: response regulator transcription factor [Candidatus Obscuribacterales bacterium]
MPKILLVEDDPDMATTIVDVLVQERHVVETAGDGTTADYMLKTDDFDVIILDWQLPGKSGLDVLKDYRATGKTTPVIMLTGKGGIDAKESGLDCGADDYITKPFEARELLARIRAVLRRAAHVSSNTLSCRDLVLDPVNYKLTKAGKDVHLTPKDFALLEFFMRNPDHVFSVETILARVWSYDSDASPDGLRAAIRRIRKAVDSSDDPTQSIIENVARVGYRLRSAK